MKTHLDCIHDWPFLARATHYRAEELAQLCDVSPRQLHLYFREYFARSPQDWLEDDAARINAFLSAVESARLGLAVKCWTDAHAFIAEAPGTFDRTVLISFDYDLNWQGRLTNLAP